MRRQENLSTSWRWWKPWWLQWNLQRGEPRCDPSSGLLWENRKVLEHWEDEMLGVTSPHRNTDLRGRSESPRSPGSDTRPPASLLRTPVARWVLGVVRKWPRWPPRCVLKKVSAALTPQTTDITPTLQLFMFVYNPFFFYSIKFDICSALSEPTSADLKTLEYCLNLSHQFQAELVGRLWAVTQLKKKWSTEQNRGWDWNQQPIHTKAWPCNQ